MCDMCYPNLEHGVDRTCYGLATALEFDTLRNIPQGTGFARPDTGEFDRVLECTDNS